MRRADRLIHRDRPTSIKAAAYSVMEQAYLAASANGTLPPNPRQIMYAARPDILAITGKDTFVEGPQTPERIATEVRSGKNTDYRGYPCW